MPTSPLPAAETPASARERWEEILDAVACAVARDLHERGVLSAVGSMTARHHFRGYLRRIINPLLDGAGADIEVVRKENRRLRAQLRESRRGRARLLARAAFLRAFSASIVAGLALLL